MKVRTGCWGGRQGRVFPPAFLGGRKGQRNCSRVPEEQAVRVRPVGARSVEGPWGYSEEGGLASTLKGPRARWTSTTASTQD